MRKEGDAKWEGLKMFATGFDGKEKHSGIKSMYNFRFKRSLGSNFVYCRILCNCTGCYNRLVHNNIEERYNHPQDNCYLWPIMRMVDSDGVATCSGYNDWRYGSFKKRIDCKLNQFHAAKADTLREIRKRYVREIIEGNFGAYCIADHKLYPYYLVEWIGEPWCADDDEVIVVGRKEFIVHKNDWLCRGIWFEKLLGGRNWYTVTANGQETIVSLETILNGTHNNASKEWR